MDYIEEVSAEVEGSKMHHALLWLLGRSYSLYFSKFHDFSMRSAFDLNSGADSGNEC